MHIQKKTKTILRRVSALLFALVICATLAVSAFADMTSSLPIRISSNGVFAVSFDNTVYTYRIPNDKPSAATGSNYICLLVSGKSYGSLTDEKELLLSYIQFSSSDWSFIPAEVPVTGIDGNLQYNGTFGGSATMRLWYASVRPNKSPTNVWTERQIALSSGFSLQFFGIYATSKKIVSTNYLWISETTYSQGYNGAIQGSLSGTGVLQGGGTIFIETPQYDFVVPEYVNTNPVYGFILGMWQGLALGADVFLKGISIGGYSLLSILTSVFIVLALFGLVVFIVKIMKGG